MLNKKMYGLGAQRSVIRELFEYGKQLKQEIGEDKVYDFTLGNPSVPCPKEVDEYASWLILNEPSTHAYTSANGDLQTRKAIADYNKQKYGFSLNENLIYMTCGAAAALKIVLTSILSEEDEEILAIAPFFPEYRVFTETSGGVFKFVTCDEVNFSINLEEFEKSISPKTRGVIINSPNNPAGTVYDEDTIKAISSILDKKQKEYGYPIYIIADEPIGKFYLTALLARIFQVITITLLFAIRTVKRYHFPAKELVILPFRLNAKTLATFT